MKKNQKSNDLTGDMLCFECGSSNLIESEVSLAGERDGETFTIRMPGLICPGCGFSTIDSTSSAQFTKLVSDAYREKHGLLTGIQIRSRREQLNQSQQEFADYLGVGVASVKRWELGRVQDKAMDELIRLKTDPHAARNNLRALELKIPEQCIVSSAVVNGKEIELSFLFDRHPYECAVPMRIDLAKFEFPPCTKREPLAA